MRKVVKPVRAWCLKEKGKSGKICPNWTNISRREIELESIYLKDHFTVIRVEIRELPRKGRK